MQIPRAGRDRLLLLALKGPDTKGNTAWREESPMCTLSSWSTLTDVELSLYMVFAELHIRSGRAIPSSESHYFQHLKLRRVVSGTSFREVVQNVAKAIIFNGNTSLKYYSFCRWVQEWFFIHLQKPGPFLWQFIERTFMVLSCPSRKAVGFLYCWALL